ncbi:hypothetical protein [Pseudomonas fluorescens]|nr:hypothetical protein [Pseudomonas fluorescens]
MTAAPLLSLTGASLHAAKNSHVELQKICSTTLATKDSAYADLAKKACDFSFKSPNVANLIASGRGADAQYLREVAINLLLLKDVSDTSNSEFASLQKKLDNLGEVYLKNHQKHSRAGDFVPTIIAHHNQKDSSAYASQVKLTAAVDAYVSNVPHVHELVRGQLHQDYLKDGLVASYQNFHGIQLDQETADKISQEGTATSAANSTVARQFLSEKQQFTSESLTNTVLIALSQLDLPRNYSAPGEPRPDERGQPESLGGSSGDRQAGGVIRDINNTQIVDVGKATDDWAQLANRLLDMLQHQPVREVLHQGRNVAVGTDTFARQTQSTSSGTESSSSPLATEHREMVERVQPHTLQLEKTKLSEGVRRTLEPTVAQRTEQDSFVEQKTLGAASDPMFMGEGLNAGRLESSIRQQAAAALAGSSSSISGIEVQADSGKMFNDSATTMYGQVDGSHSAPDLGKIDSRGSQPIAPGQRELIVQERLEPAKEGAELQVRSSFSTQPTMLSQSIKQTIERPSSSGLEHGSGATEVNSGQVSLRETGTGTSRTIDREKGAGWSILSRPGPSSVTSVVGSVSVHSELESVMPQWRRRLDAAYTATDGNANAKGGGVGQDRAEPAKDSSLSRAPGTFTPEALYQSINQGKERVTPATLEQATSATAVDSRLMTRSEMTRSGTTHGTGADANELSIMMQAMRERISTRYTDAGELVTKRSQSNVSEAPPTEGSAKERFVSAMAVAQGSGTLTAAASKNLEAVKLAILAQKAAAGVSDSEHPEVRIMPDTAIPIVRSTKGPASEAQEPLSTQKSENTGARRAKQGSILQRVQDLRASVKNTATPFALKPGLEEKLIDKESGSLAFESQPAGGRNAE